MDVIKTSDGRYKISGKVISQLLEIPGAVRALKKPIPIVALKINTVFTVETSEGIMTGKPGDYLMEGISGEMYICPAEIFIKSYDIL